MNIRDHQPVLALLATGLLGAVVVSTILHGVRPPGHSRNSAASKSWPELDALLDNLARAWRPADRGAILAAVRRDPAPYVDGLRHRIRSPGRDDRLRLIELCGELALLELHPTLFVIAVESDNVAERAAAIRASTRIAPIDERHLEGFLAEPQHEIVIAGLEALIGREHDVWQPLFALLLSDDPRIRTAAANALPCELQPQFERQLRKFTTHGESDTVARVIRTLASPNPSAELEDLMVSLLDRPDSVVHRAVLDALCVKSGGLRDPSLIWEVVRSPLASPAMQSRALLVFERTGGADLEQLEAVTRELAPLPKYYAARCLLTLGEAAGLAALIEVIEDTAGSSAADAGCGRAVQQSARRILAEVSGTTPQATVADWREWLHKSVNLEPLKLAPPPPLEVD